jgi:rubrerythrin
VPSIATKPPQSTTRATGRSKPRVTPAPAAPAKPSYIKLLNGIAVAEHGGHAYLSAWAETTKNAQLATVLSFVAVREAEHHHAFRKRLVELGYDVRFPADDSAAAADVAMARSRSTDLTKWKHFKLGTRHDNDIFDDMFHDKTIDPITGGLLGRFIAEERDSVRRFAECYESGVVGAR